MPPPKLNIIAKSRFAEIAVFWFEKNVPSIIPNENPQVAVSKRVSVQYANPPIPLLSMSNIQKPTRDTIKGYHKNESMLVMTVAIK
jgi:hypothetical protein